jgi:hypothetical protein
LAKSSTISGDLINAGSILNMVVFGAMVAAQFKGYLNLLDESFISDGFCVSNKDMSPYWQSHMLCFYGDTVMAALIWASVKFLGDGMTEEALKPVKV